MTSQWLWYSQIFCISDTTADISFASLFPDDDDDDDGGGGDDVDDDSVVVIAAADVIVKVTVMTICWHLVVIVLFVHVDDTVSPLQCFSFNVSWFFTDQWPPNDITFYCNYITS